MNKDASERLSIIVYDHHFDKVHYALVIASASAAIGRPTTLFFTMGACEILQDNSGKDTPAWHKMPLSDRVETGQFLDHFYARNGIGTVEELIDACNKFDVRFMVCEMGLRAKGLQHTNLRNDLNIELGGIVTFLKDASKNGMTIFI